MSGSAYSFTRKIIFLGRIVSPCTYTSFCRAITFDNQPWLFAWKRAASVSVSRVNSLYNPCDEFLVRFFPLPCLRCFRAIAPVSVFRRRAPRRRHNFTRKTARCLLSQLSRCFKDEQAYIEAAISKLYIYIYIQGNQDRGETSSPLRKAKRAWYSLRMVSLGVWAEISWQNNYHGTMMMYSSFVLI